jgi:transposase
MALIKTRRKFDKDFKRKVVAMSFEKTLRELSEELGIGVNVISRWRKEYTDLGETSFPGHGKEAIGSEEQEIRRLRKQVAELELEHAILKKAIRIFSKNDGKSINL